VGNANVREIVGSPSLYTAEWWGEPLSADLIRRVAAAPSEHLDEFSESWHSSVWPDLQPGVPNIEPRIEPTSSAVLRPLLPWHPDSSPLALANRAVHLLLYAHEVVLPDPFAALLGRWRPKREEVLEVLEALVLLEPLREEGLVHFASPELSWTTNSASQTQSEPDIYWDERTGDLLCNWYDAGSRFGTSELTQIGVKSVDASVDLLHRELQLALKAFKSALVNGGRFHALAGTASQIMLHRSLVEMGYVDTQRRAMLNLNRLSSLALPTIALKTDQLVALRRSSVRFAEWRQALGTGLASMGDLQCGGAASLDEARGALQEALEPVRAQVAEEVRTSPSLSAARSGVGSFSLAAVSVGAAALLGNPLAPALVGAGAAKTAESIYRYTRALRNQRQNRAVLDLALYFGASD
jgi:hypothetical protein